MGFFQFFIFLKKILHGMIHHIKPVFFVFNKKKATFADIINQLHLYETK